MNVRSEKIESTEQAEATSDKEKPAPIAPQGSARPDMLRKRMDRNLTGNRRRSGDGTCIRAIATPARAGRTNRCRRVADWGEFRRAHHAEPRPILAADYSEGQRAGHPGSQNRANKALHPTSDPPWRRKPTLASRRCHAPCCRRASRLAGIAPASRLILEISPRPRSDVG